MEKGRGNLIFGIPGKKSRAGEELMVAAVVVAPNQSRRRSLRRTQDDALLERTLQHYLGSRGQRGAVLPRGWRKVDRLSVE